MPNIKSAKKRLRQTERQTESNAPFKTRVKSARRKFQESLEAGDKAVSDEAYRLYCSALDKAAKKGVLCKNTATRRKGRAANALRAIA